MAAMEAEEAAQPAQEHMEGAAQAPSKHKLSKKKLKKMQEAYDRRGIIYISRIPPHLKPQKLRHLLSQHGEIGRVYLAPEDPMLRKKRKREGKNTGKNFTEGWVEFEDKKVAKQVVEMLNGQPMGGKRRSAFFYDLWCMKYLPKFKWDHLTEEINYQKAVREQKLAAEISAAKRERDFYLSRVDKAKAVTAILERKRKKADGEGAAAAEPSAAGGGDGSGTQPNSAPGQTEQQQQQPAKKHKKQHGFGGAAGGAAGEERRGGSGAGGAGGMGSAAPPGAKVLRTYGQRKAKPDPVADAEAPVLSEGVLRLIAGKNK